MTIIRYVFLIENISITSFKCKSPLLFIVNKIAITNCYCINSYMISNSYSCSCTLTKLTSCCSTSSISNNSSYSTRSTNTNCPNSCYRAYNNCSRAIITISTTIINLNSRNTSIFSTISYIYPYNISCSTYNSISSCFKNLPTTKESNLGNST